MGSIPISSNHSIRGRVVEGTGLIIRFPIGTALVRIQSNAEKLLLI